MKNESKKKNNPFVTIKKESIYNTLESLQLTLESGSDLLSSINAIKEDISEQKLKDVLSAITHDLQSGAKLWESVAKYRLLPQRAIEIIKIGEENGLLVDNLKIVISQRKFEAEIKSQVRSAMIYPAIILSIGLFVAIGTVWFILPQITLIYEGLDIQLPLITRVLIYVGGVIQEINILYLITFFIGIALTISLLFKSESSREKIERIAFKLPGIGVLLKDLEISRMGMILGSLLTVGINIDRAILSLKEATPFLIYKKEYQGLHHAILSGSSFKSYYKDSNPRITLPPSTVRQMVDSGERSANLPQVFSYLAEKYRDKVKEKAKNLTIIIEPILLIMMWGVVSIIAISIVLPIYSLIGSF